MKKKVKKFKLAKMQTGGVGCPPGYYFDFDKQQCVKGDFNVTISSDPNIDRGYYDPNTKSINIRANTDPHTIYHEENHAEQDRNGLFSPYRGAPLNTAVLGLYDKTDPTYEDMRYGRRDADINNIVKNFPTNFTNVTGYIYTPDMMFAGNGQRSNVAEDLQYGVPGTAEYDAEHVADNATNHIQQPPDNVNFIMQDSTNKKQLGGNMKKKIKKFQLAGSNNPCGPGTTWDGTQCVPEGQVSQDPNRPTMYPENNDGSPVNFNIGARTKGNGTVVPSDVKPLWNSNSVGPFNYNVNTNAIDNSRNNVFDSKAGMLDARGNFVPSQNVIGDAIDKGFNYDSDGVYRKQQITTDNNSLGYSDPFKALNVGLDLTSLVAGKINDANTYRTEQDKLTKARYNTSQYNPYEAGLNQVPAYFKEGGELSPNEARKILHDGTVNGKKITDKQRKFFGVMSKGTTLKFKPKMQTGGQPLTQDQLAKFSNFANSTDTHTINMALSNYNLKNAGNLLDPTQLGTQPGQDVRSTRQDWIGSETMRALMNARRMNIPPAAFTSNAGVIFGQDGRYGDTILNNSDFKNMYPNYMEVASNIYKDRYNNYNPQQPLNIDPSTAQVYKMGGIHINPKHKGLFTKEAKAAGMSVKGFAAKVLANKSKYSPAVVKRANFAHNFAQNGGLINNTGYTPGTSTYNNPVNIIPSNNITMANTPFNVMAYPEQGNPVLMRPGKNYKFGKSKYVKEIPMKQDGGDIQQQQGPTMSLPQYEQMKATYLQYLKEAHNSYETNVGDSQIQQLYGVIANNMQYFEPGGKWDKLQDPTVTYNAGDAQDPNTQDTNLQTGGFVPAYQPQYTMPSAYMIDHLHPDYPITQQDSTAYKTLFNQVLQNPYAYNLQAYEKQAQDNYTNHNENTDAVNKANYMKDAVNAAAVRDALQQLNAQINKKQYQTGGTPEVEGQGPGENPAELEQGEVYQSQQGQIQKIAESGDTHEDGGVVRNDVSRVLEDTADKRTDPNSKTLKVTPTEAQDMVGFKPKGTVTHSKLYEQATKFYDGKLKTLEGKLSDNIDYINQDGGQYAKRSLEENLKLLQAIPTRADLFDKIYNHQEAVKQENNIVPTGQQQMVGGRVKFDIGGVYPPPSDEVPVDPYAGGKTKKGRTTPTGRDNAFQYPGGLPAYQNVWGKAGIDLSKYTNNSDAQAAIYDYLLKTDPNKIKDMWHTYGNTAAGISAGMPAVLSDSYLSDPANLAALKKGYVDNFLGKRTLTPDGQPVPQIEVPATPVADNSAPPADNTNYTKPNAVVPSTFNEPLHWYDVAGNLGNYMSADERTPVSFEQMSRDPLRVHEENPLPTLLANQGDFNASVAQLPTNGVGFANQANLAANKYKVNNQILGQYENVNQGKYDQVDNLNNQSKYQLDSTNLQLRNNAQQEQLQGMEAQRQSKLKALNDMFTTIAENNKLNREGNLVMQMYPYFDQNGKFNDNQYVQRLNSEGNTDIVDRQTGKTVHTIVKDANDQVKSSKYTTVKTNK